MQKSTPPEERGAPAPRRARGRPRKFDRAAALEQAVRLFWRKGYDATSMADLTSAMGIGAPSLYAAFGSKEALYAEALAFYQERFGDRAWGRFDAAPTARAAIEGLLADSAVALTGADPAAPAGCMLALAAVDRDEHAALCDTVRRSRAAARDRLEARLRRAVDDGEIPPATDVPDLARFVQAVQQGMSLLARDGATRAELAGVARVAMAGWDAAVR